MVTTACTRPLTDALDDVAAAHESLVRAARELAAGHASACGGSSVEAAVDGALALAVTRSVDNVAALAETLAAAVVRRPPPSVRVAHEKSAGGDAS